MISTEDANLEKFGRHVPRILGNQIITQLIAQYLSSEHSPLIDPEFENTCPPSIERFHGALLFVDISGFTVLSQRLPVDALRLHINAYFKKILDIIFKYGGDVVKFAGDALFIIWQTPVSSLDAPNFHEAAKLSVQRAVSCGLEINVECSNYRIDLAPKNKQASQLTSALLEKKTQSQNPPPKLSSVNSGGSDSTVGSLSTPGPPHTQRTRHHTNGSVSPCMVSPPNELSESPSESSASSPQGTQRTSAPFTPITPATPSVSTPVAGAATPTANNVETDTITYLNVHSGVGVGVMAGIDVGAQNRWEYLLLGQPLSDVAVAESMAAKGELVISPEAHALLCGTSLGATNTNASSFYAVPEAKTNSIPKPSPKRCNCIACEGNAYFMRVDPNIPWVAPVNTETPEELAEYELYFYSEIMDRTTVAYREIMGQIDELGYHKFKLSPPNGNLTTISGSGGMLGSASTGTLATYSMLSPRQSIGMMAHLSPRSDLRGSLDNSSHSTGPNSTANSTANSVTNSVRSERSPMPLHVFASPSKSAASAALGVAERLSLSNPSAVPAAAPVAVADEAQVISNLPSMDFTLSASSEGSRSFNNLREHVVSHITTIDEEGSQHSGVVNTHTLSSIDMTNMQLNSSSAQNINSNSSSYSLQDGPNNQIIPTKCSAEVTEMLFGHYLSWVQQCLLDDFAMHVHEADRTDFEFKGQSRKGALEKFATSQPGTPHFLNGTHNTNTTNSTGATTTGSNFSAFSNNHLQTSTSTMSLANMNISSSNLASGTPPRRSSLFKSFAASNASARENTSFVSRMRTMGTPRQTLKEQNKSKNRRIRQQDTSLTAELRNVIVLFISVKLDSEQLVMSRSDAADPRSSSVKMNSNSSTSMSEKCSEKASAHCYVHSGDKIHGRIKSFCFLSRTEEEFNDDQRIMNSFQDCMEIMTKNFKKHGGQLRQFIVDDKGTVCIGTFGLRGSVTNDNAAAAIDAAGAIIFQLHKIGIKASIGITSGKAYCGLVGSPLRHEYAVMGPSTNLSARLMGKAKPGEVMCDGDTRSRDRTHTFQKLGEIQAKGYAVPVPTFKPNLYARSAHQSTNGGAALSAQGLTRAETHSGKGNTLFFDGNSHMAFSSSNLRYVHGSLADLASNSGSGRADLLGASTPMNRNKARLRKKINSLHLDPQKLPLEGRVEEIDSVFSFLCPGFVAQYGPLSKFNVERKAFSAASSTNKIPTFSVTSPPLSSFSGFPQIALHFDTTAKTKASIIQGPTGIGKSSFIKLFCEKVRNLYKVDRSVNMFLFHNSTNGNNTQPFNVWKGIIRQLLLSFNQLAFPMGGSRANLPRTGSVHAQQQQDSTEVASSTGKVELLRGLDYATSLLGDEYKDLKPLMTAIQFVHGQQPNEATAKLSGVSKLLRITEYLSALIQQFTITTGKILFIAIEDMETMDSASWQLLKHLWEHNTGVVICASHASNVTTKKGVDLNLFRDLDRIYLLDLKPLGLAATKIIATRIFESNDVFDVEDAVYEKLYTMSGGNALFLYELAKAMLEWYHNSLDDGLASEMNSNNNSINNNANSNNPNPVTAPTTITISPPKKMSFSDAIQDFRTTRIEEVICYRFDQFDTAAQLLLKLASVACANSEVFTLRLLSHMIQDDTGSAGGVFACLKSVNSMDNLENTAFSLTNGNLNNNERIEEEELGFEADVDDHNGNNAAEWELRSDSVLVTTLSGLLHNNEFIRVVKKRDATIGQSVRAVRHQLQDLSEGSNQSLLDGDGDEEEENDDDVVGELSPMNISPLKTLSKLKPNPVTFAPSLSGIHNADSAESLSKQFFDFKIRLEQSTIYDLMLDDQKQALHERVATYLEMQSLQRPNGTLSSTELYEEGFHWERATGWSSAMGCYYRSAMIHDELGAFQESFLHLTAAYRMFNAMRQEAGVTEDFQFVAASFQAIFSHSEHHANSNNPAGTAQTLKKSDIIRIFDGDSSLLELGLNVLLRLAQSSFSLSDNPEVTSKLYEDALQLIMLTWDWKDALALNSNFGASLGLAEGTLDDTTTTNNTNNSANTPNTGHSSNTPLSPHRLKRVKTMSSDIDATSFGLKDPTIVFPILAGIAALYRNNKLQDDKSRNKESTLYDLSLVLARTSPAYLPHLICAMCLQRTLLFELGRVKESLTMAEGIASMYNEAEHAGVIIKAYGDNRVPYTIMMHVQLLRIVGFFNKSFTTMNNVLATLPEMTHLHSVGMTVYPAISVMMLEGSQRYALKVFRNYLSLEKERGGYNFFKESNPLFLEALETAVCYEQFTVQKDLSFYLAHCDCVNAQAIEAKILNKEYLPVDGNSRSMLYDTLSSFGTSIEHCCGFMLLLRARMTSKRIEMRPAERSALVLKYLTVALEYENFHVSTCMEPEQRSVLPTSPSTKVKMVPIDRLAFAHFGSLITKACILIMLAYFEPEGPVTTTTAAAASLSPNNAQNNSPTNAPLPDKAECIAQASACLQQCEEIGTRLGYHFITLHAGVYLEILGLDTRRGKQLQVQALDAMQAMNGPKEFALVFDSVIEAFPILERFKIKYTMLSD